MTIDMPQIIRPCIYAVLSLSELASGPPCDACWRPPSPRRSALKTWNCVPHNRQKQIHCSRWKPAFGFEEKQDTALVLARETICAEKTIKYIPYDIAWAKASDPG